MATNRLIKNKRLVSPWRGFYLILRPEDKILGAPEPVRWIDPLMKYLGVDYRISLLTAASFQGSSHQAAMVFQVIVPKQMRAFELGRHRIQFIYQTPDSFTQTNQPEWLTHMKSESGYAKMAGPELLLLDSVRYLHRAGGLNSVAQVVHDLGARAGPRKLAKLASCYENSSVRRLGYLLEHVGHKRQAKALTPFAASAKSLKPLDPSVHLLTDYMPQTIEKDSLWKLSINEQLKIDD